MSAGLDFASSHRSRAEEVVSTVPLQSFSMTAMSRLEGRPVVRSPEQLRVHRALDELDLMDVAGELNDAARLSDLFPPEPILITTNGRSSLA